MSEKQTGMLHLSEELLLGRGAHKVAYIDPRDKTRCIKIPYREHDSDLAREMNYRKALKHRGRSPELLTAYYGTVETDKGTGYVFERVVDFDGQPSLELDFYFQRVQEGKAEGWPPFVMVLERLRILMRRECIVVPKNCAFDDMLVQRLSPNPDDFTVRIIDDMGSRAAIPLLFYWDFLARRHAAKSWRRWMGILKKDFPSLATPPFLKKHHLEEL